jgi:hypothetical protein
MEALAATLSALLAIANSPTLRGMFYCAIISKCNFIVSVRMQIMNGLL